jgi:hypothetical protein
MDVEPGALKQLRWNQAGACVASGVRVDVRSGQLASGDVGGVGAHVEDERGFGVVGCALLEFLGEEDALAAASRRCVLGE